MVSSSSGGVAFRLLLAVVVLSPLPLGGNRPLAWSALAVAVAVLAVGWMVMVLSGRWSAAVPGKRLLLIGGLFALPLAWAVLQTSSLLPSHLWHPLWAEANTALGVQAGAISVSPPSTWTAIMRLACYGVVFLLAAQLATDRGLAHEAMVVLIVASTLYAGYGLLVYFLGSESILWMPKWAYLGDLTSTFVNRNAYGAFAGLGLICAVAMFVHRLRPRRNESRGLSDWMETLLVRASPYLLAALVIGSALLLSHSRGAFLCSGLALVVLMGALILARVLPPGLAVRIGAGIFVVALVALVMNGERTLDRLVETGTTTAEDGRPDVYRLTLQAIGDAPLTGHGLGAFQPAFRMYRDSSLNHVEDWQFAHSIYLETAMDLGLPAALAFFAAIAAILVACAAGLRRRRRDHIYPATALAAAALVGAHGVIDFSGQMPAIALMLALLLGIGYAQSWSSRPSNETLPASDPESDVNSGSSFDAGKMP